MSYRFRLLLVTCISCLGLAPGWRAGALTSQFESSVRDFSAAFPAHSQLIAAQPKAQTGTAQPKSKPKAKSPKPPSVAPLATSNSNSAPSPSAQADTAISAKDWIWWGTIALVPIAAVGGVLYGLGRSTANGQKHRTVRQNAVQSKSLSKPELNGSADPTEPVHSDRQKDSALEEEPRQPLSEHVSKDEFQRSGEGNPPPQAPLDHFRSPEAAFSQTTRLSKVDIVEELIGDLHSPNPGNRRKAIWDLGQRGDSRAVQPLTDLLVDSDSQQRSLILAAISEISIRTLKPMNRALLMSLQDDSSEVRKNAIRDVTRIYDLVAQISQLLQYAASDSDGEVRDTAQWALTQLNRIRSSPETESLPRGSSPSSIEPLPGDASEH